jgi:hypothetical protein
MPLLCYSPEADLTFGIVIVAIGVIALRRVQHRREIALAAIPLVLGVHQIVEAFAWWGLQGPVPAELGTAAVWFYLMIALGGLPLLVPGALIAIEPSAARRRLMVPFAVVGVAVAVVLVSAVLRGPIGAEIAGRYLAYEVHVGAANPIASLYAFAVCGPLLVSSHRRLAALGVMNLVAVAALAWLQENALISLWCVWAAATSVIIAVHLHDHSRPMEREHSPFSRTRASDRDGTPAGAGA